MNILLQRKLSSILITDVKIDNDDLAFEQEFNLHIEQKKMFQSLSIGDVDFEEILEALEVFIGTSSMDDYLLDITPKLHFLCDAYGVPD